MNHWLLNSAVIAVDGDGDYNYRTVSKEDAILWLKTRSFISRIGYPDNADFIKRISGVRVSLSREESKLLPEDEALVVRPKYRLPTGQNKGQFKPEDDDFVFGILRRST